jgi:hypothetical protein
MTSKITYRVSVYTKRATCRMSDTEYASIHAATRGFNAEVKCWIDDIDSCVLLSRGDATLAAKNTNDNFAVFHRAYYS